jgi:DUF1365 family protein
MHMRLAPFAHRFSYRVFTLLLDVDRLEETTTGLRLMALDRFGLFAFHRRDHGPRDGGPLRPWVEARLAEAGLPPPERLLLVAMPRLLGYAFNPLSVFFGYDAVGRLESLVYEVKNTFGDQHPYAHAFAPDADGAARHAQVKEFFVSPFLSMAQTYSFTVRPPGARLAIRIRQRDPEGATLIATQSGAAEPLTDAALRRVALAMPFATLKVIAAIHWQALRLWLKGATFFRYPGADRVVQKTAPHQAAAGAASHAAGGTGT